MVELHLFRLKKGIPHSPTCYFKLKDKQESKKIMANQSMGTERMTRYCGMVKLNVGFVAGRKLNCLSRNVGIL